jgi:hypothetical protein
MTNYNITRDAGIDGDDNNITGINIIFHGVAQHPHVDEVEGVGHNR